MKPFTKNLEELNNTIAKYKETIIFGDKFHNGVNLPYRIYEALMNGVQPKIAKELIGEQELEIGLLMAYIAGGISRDAYLSYLELARDEIVDELLEFITKAILLKEEPICIVKDEVTFNYKGLSEDNRDSVKDILATRATVYGSYYDGVECRGQIMHALNEKHISTKNCDLPENVRVVFSDLVLKLMRAASDPMHADSWLDLAGYAKLINEMFEENPYVFES
jgi:hypothetical protein